MSREANKSLGSEGSDTPRRRRRWGFLGSTLGSFAALCLVLVLFGVADSMQERGGKFLTGSNVRALAVQTAVVAVAALGMTVIIISGGIDLSAGTALALCATVLAWSLKEDVALLIARGNNVSGATSELKEATERAERLRRELEETETEGEPAGAGSRPAGMMPGTAVQRDTLAELNASLPGLRARLDAVVDASKTWTPYTPAVAVALCIGVGCACGFLNGALVSLLRVVPFIVTLGTMTVFLGVAKIVAEETTVRPDRATQVPAWLSDFLSNRAHALWLGFPVGVWLCLAVAIVLAALLRYTVFSRHVFAIGSNESTARLCGINVEWNKIAVYTLGGFFVGMAGLYQFSRLATGTPTSGVGLELKIIAAVVIGGGSLSGGRGSVLGTLTGAAIMAVIGSGCTQLGLSNPIQDIIIGVIIVAAVAVDRLRRS